MRSALVSAMVASALALAISAPAAAQEAARPSFPCDKARSLDEKAICSDARLAELDRIHASEYAKARRKDRVAADREAQDIIVSRGNCGNDRVCIFDALRYSLPEAAVPTWVDSYRDYLVQDVTKDNLSLRSLAVVGRRGMFVMSEKEVEATVMSIEGIDTDHALSVGKITGPDYREYCERDPGGETVENGGKLTVEQCARQEQRDTTQTTFRSRANCPAMRVMLWSGTWTVVSYNAGGITWKDPQGKVEDPWAGTAAPESQFELLCPNALAQIRAAAAQKKRRADPNP